MGKEQVLFYKRLKNFKFGSKNDIFGYFRHILRFEVAKNDKDISNQHPQNTKFCKKKL